MKNLKYLFITAFVFTLLACSSDDDGSTELTGHNTVVLEFDNGYAGNDLVLGQVNAANGNGEQLTVNRFSYIVSNFQLVNKEGDVYTFPKDDSYFIISQEADLHEVSLPNIPAGEYVAVKFGLGVDQEKYLQGAEGQGDFLQQAEAHNMMWSWAAGYKFLNYEGTFTSETLPDATDFKIHMGSHGTALDNYQEVELVFPNNILVSDSMSPNVHMMVDASKVLTANTEIALSEKAVIMVDEVKSPQIAVNASQMFMVHHVHNGSGDHH